jgi:hypothetical protein
VLRRFWVSLAIVLFSLSGLVRGQSSIAEVSLTAGWATFGVSAPQQAATHGLAIGALPTQTDVKTRWPDGSIRFAVVTALVPSSGSYRLAPASAGATSFVPTVPTTSVSLTIGGVVYSAALATAPTADSWLAGAQVREWRQVVTPTSALGAHPFLRVYFDTRVYRDGQARVDVTVENSLDVATATKVTYDVVVAINGQTRFSKAAVEHYWLSRWRKVFDVGLNAATVTDDMMSLQRLKVLPVYLPLVANVVDEPVGPKFELLQSGKVHIPMNDHGGRAEIGPYPAWIARYAVHRNAAQKAYVLAQADQSGSWPIHIREVDGSVVSIDQRPNFFMGKAGAPPEDGPRGDVTNGSQLHSWIPDRAHQPSLAVVPYLLTGDRFYMDEMRFWANYTLLSTYTDSYGKARGATGSEGLITQGGGSEVRGMGWGLRSLTDAAIHLPDGESRDKPYFAQKVRNNLQWFNEQADIWAQKYPLGFSFPHKRPEDTFPLFMPYTWIADWEQAYVAWAIQHANDLGIAGGERLRDRICRWVIKEFSSDADGFDSRFGVNYVSAVGTNVVPGDMSSQIIAFTSMGQVFKANFPAPIESDLNGNYHHSVNSGRGWTGPDTRLALVVAAQNGLPGASEALRQIWNDLAVVNYTNNTTDLGNRAQFAIAVSPTILNDSAKTLGSPKGVRIVPKPKS